MSRVRIGCDPEIFVCDIKTGKAVPITGKIGGTKERPKFIEKNDPFFKGWGKVSGWALQEDGAALEFNTPAFQNGDDFATNVEGFSNSLTAYLETLGLEPIRSSCVTFDKELLEQSPKAFILGCDPDYNAYTGKENPVPAVETMGMTRFGAGHIHVGYVVDDIPHDIMAKFLDLTVGLPLTSCDKQGARRNFYGKAGNYRPKKYGIEYRTPSNYWVWRATSPHIYPLFRNILRLASAVTEDSDSTIRLHSAIPWDVVENAITTENTKDAKQVLEFAYKINRHLLSDPLSCFNYGVKAHASAA